MKRKKFISFITKISIVTTIVMERVFNGMGESLEHFYRESTQQPLPRQKLLLRIIAWFLISFSSVACSLITILLTFVAPITSISGTLPEVTTIGRSKRIFQSGSAVRASSLSLVLLIGQ